MIEIVQQHFTLETPSGAPLRGDIRWNDTPALKKGKKLPVVIVSHGFKAFKDWGPFPAIGCFFAQNGFVSIVFNFSHNGIGSEPKKFIEHKKFVGNTISLEIDDLKTIKRELESVAFGLPFIDVTKIGLVGHSRGGGVSLITAKEEASVKAVAAWGTIARLNRYTEDQRKRWREKGFVQLHSVSDQKLFRINTTLLDDLEGNKERFNLFDTVAQLQKPLLIVHGTADVPVKIEEAEELFEASNKNFSEFVRLEGSGHMFGSRHPYRDESPALNHVLLTTSNWLHKHLHTED